MRRTETIPDVLAGERIDKVVAMLTGLTRAAAADLVASGEVRVDGRPVTTRSRRVAEGELVDVPATEAAVDEAPAPEPSLDVPVVFADEHVIVVDKPAGLVVHPGAGNDTGTMVNGLLARFPELAGVGDPERPGVVHRLDKGTSGLLVVARTDLAYRSLTAQLAAHTAERRYTALAWGEFEAPEGLVDAPVGRGSRDRTRMAVSAEGREARTRYSVVELFHDPVLVSLVACRLETGRTHQIRVHLAAIHHPVVGDARYGGARPTLPMGRPFLHAVSLAFDHPASGERVTFTSPLPADLEEVRGQLR
jgi:23S rRNA pseudouridine1911/1915/1917 synthase